MELPFTQAQRDVLDQIEELLKEHFDSSILCVQSNCETEDGQEDKTFFYHGGMSTAIGLAEIHLRVMKRDAADRYGRLGDAEDYEE